MSNVASALFLFLWLTCGSTQQSEQCMVGEDELSALLQNREIEVLTREITTTQPLGRSTNSSRNRNSSKAWSQRGKWKNETKNSTTWTRKWHTVVKSNGTNSTKITNENVTDHNDRAVVTRKRTVVTKHRQIKGDTIKEGEVTKKWQGTGNGSYNGTKNNSKSDKWKKPFVDVKTNKTWKVQRVSKKVNATTNSSERREVSVETTEVIIATPRNIVTVHMLFFTPLAVCWAFYFYLGKPKQLYSIFLPATLCAMMIAQDLVNQSLAFVTKAPLGITACQAGFMALVTGGWCATVDQHIIKQSDLRAYADWWIVAVFFTLYQLINHLVSLKCSLSERTVFTNLCPVVSLALELLIMPAALKPTATIRSQLSLATLVAGALFFGMASPDFTPVGILSASALVGAIVPYRIFQRSYLNDEKLRSIGLLAFIDGLLVFVVAMLAASFANRRFLSDLLFWFRHPSILLMLLLSAVTFTGTHICGLMLLRVSSATAYLVFQSIASFIEVALGILYFGDEVFGTPLACIGLGLSLASGLWYSSEVCAQNNGSHGGRNGE